MTVELAAFLLARIAEDESMARAAADQWHSRWATADRQTAYGWRNGKLGAEPKMPMVVADNEHGSLMLMSLWENDQATVRHVARHDPDRVLAECAAKRELIAWVQRYEVVAGAYPDLPRVDGARNAARMALRYVALSYADHPDYREEWRP